jgi:hypothetical protein
MFILIKNKHTWRNTLVASRADHDMESLRQQFANAHSGEWPNPPFECEVTDCGSVGSPRESLHSICRCEWQCHSGRSIKVHEIVIIDDDAFEFLKRQADMDVITID